jgi:O-antigen ligase
MAACPIISLSRAGAIISMLNLTLAAIILFFGLRRAHGAAKFGLFVFFVAILIFGLNFGPEKLAERMKDFNLNLHQREQIYETARTMAREHPVFGTGPGTFNVLFQFYRHSEDEYYPAQLHNDWLETLITFGWVGFTLILAAFVAVIAHWFKSDNIQTSPRFTYLIWLALGGGLLFARFDFPFQNYSVLFLFVLICTILSTLSRRGKPS